MTPQSKAKAAVELLEGMSIITAKSRIGALELLRPLAAGTHVLVPVEPTEAMIEAGRPCPPDWDRTPSSKMLRETCNNMRRADWASMLTASQEQQIPEQPSQLEQTQELFTE